MLKYFLKVLLFLFMAVLLTSGTWALWERNRDPLCAIDLDVGKTAVARMDSFALTSGPVSREYRHLFLSTEHSGVIEAFISLPKTIPSGGLPVVMILGGLEITAEDFRLIQSPGNNIFIIYRYPYSPRYWYEGAPFTEIPAIRKSVFRVPSQVLALERWVSRQSWAQSGRITIAGFSFGAMFLPAVYHLAYIKKVHLNPGIIAYGGADIDVLLETNLKKRISRPLLRVVSWLGATAIYPIEPALHLPHMNNEFLIINGTRDHQVPEQSWKKLQALTAEPKTVILLDEGHMHFRKPKLTMKLVEISRKWLLERKLVN